MPATALDNLTDREFASLAEMVHRHCGINLHDGKKELVRARIAKRLRATGAADVAAYLRRLQAPDAAGEFTHLIDAISTNLTSFFREGAHFAFLLDRFLPALLERKRRSGDRRLRAWSAGCSTGEEPYSLAMTVHHALGGEAGWDVRLLATDISTRVLAAAQQGVYDRARAAGIPPQLRPGALEPVQRPDGGSGRRDAALRVADHLRELIQFSYLNLMEPWPFRGPFDFIFCRNVMIYFDKPTQEKLVNRFFDCLDAGGLLFTGHSESLTGIAHRFRYVQPTIYARP